MNNHIVLLGELARVQAGNGEASALARRIVPHVFRTEVSGSGFALLDLGPAISPGEFRRTLVALAGALADAYRERFGRTLAFRSVGRFDQKRSTEAHLDGGPEESVLILGYEPTVVESRLFLLDYTRAAVDRGMRPKEFLDRFNPALGGEELSAEYVTEVEPFDAGHYRVVFINNSCTPYEQRERGSLGVLHQGTVGAALPEESRWVNTMMMFPPIGRADAREDTIRAEDLRAFEDSGTYKSI